MSKPDSRPIELVDTTGRVTGLTTIHDAHAGNGRLHPAVSVLLFRRRGEKTETLIQKRSGKKLRWPGIWANAVCSHPVPGEPVAVRAARRLQEELGISVPDGSLEKLFSFIYDARWNNRWSECEYDTVFAAVWSGGVKPDPDEVSEVRWIPLEELRKNISESPDAYSPWLKIMIRRPEVDLFIRNTGSGGPG